MRDQSLTSPITRLFLLSPSKRPRPHLFTSVPVTVHDICYHTFLYIKWLFPVSSPVSRGQGQAVSAQLGIILLHFPLHSPSSLLPLRTPDVSRICPVLRARLPPTSTPLCSSQTLKPVFAGATFLPLGGALLYFGYPRTYGLQVQPRISTLNFTIIIARIFI